MSPVVKRLPQQMPLLDEIEGRLSVAQFASEMPERIDLLRRAVVIRDFAWLRRLARQLYGAASVYGFHQLAEQAAVLDFLLSTEAGDVVLAAATEVLIDACGAPQAMLDQQP